MGDAVILGDGPERITHPQIAVAARKGRAGDAHRLCGNRWNLLELQCHKPSPPGMAEYHDRHRDPRSSQTAHVGWIRPHEFATSI